MTLLTVEDRGSGIVVVTLTDPARRNALSAEMAARFRDAVEALARDRDLRVVVVTGSPPAFSAGGDLSMLEAQAREAVAQPRNAAASIGEFYRSFLTIRDLPVPVIAAVNGDAIGAGLCLALACDLRLVAESARISTSFARLGLYPGMGCTWFLPRIVGPQLAAEMLFTGKMFDGRELRDSPLAAATCPARDVLDRALALAADIAKCSPAVLRRLKMSLNATQATDLEDHLLEEAAAQVVSLRSDDFAEGMAALAQKRSPRFTSTIQDTIVRTV